MNLFFFWLSTTLQWFPSQWLSLWGINHWPVSAVVVQFHRLLPWRAQPTTSPPLRCFLPSFWSRAIRPGIHKHSNINLCEAFQKARPGVLHQPFQGVRCTIITSSLCWLGHSRSTPATNERTSSCTEWSMLLSWLTFLLSWCAGLRYVADALVRSTTPAAIHGVVTALLYESSSYNPWGGCCCISGKEKRVISAVSLVSLASMTPLGTPRWYCRHSLLFQM